MSFAAVFYLNHREYEVVSTENNVMCSKTREKLSVPLLEDVQQKVFLVRTSLNKSTYGGSLARNKFYSGRILKIGDSKEGLIDWLQSPQSRHVKSKARKGYDSHDNLKEMEGETSAVLLRSQPHQSSQSKKSASQNTYADLRKRSIAERKKFVDVYLERTKKQTDDLSRKTCSQISSLDAEQESEEDSEDDYDDEDDATGKGKETSADDGGADKAWEAKEKVWRAKLKDWEEKEKAWQKEKAALLEKKIEPPKKQCAAGASTPMLLPEQNELTMLKEWMLDTLVPSIVEGVRAVAGPGGTVTAPVKSQQNPDQILFSGSKDHDLGAGLKCNITMLQVLKQDTPGRWLSRVVRHIYGENVKSYRIWLSGTNDASQLKKLPDDQKQVLTSIYRTALMEMKRLGKFDPSSQQSQLKKSKHKPMVYENELNKFSHYFGEVARNAGSDRHKPDYIPSYKKKKGEHDGTIATQEDRITESKKTKRRVSDAQEPVASPKRTLDGASELLFNTEDDNVDVNISNLHEMDTGLITSSGDESDSTQFSIK